MADVKWIKICTDIFDDEKILLIEGMPDADSIIVVWFKLLCMAGKQNNGGVFMLNDKLAYTDEMLATVFRKPLNTVRLALKTFEQFGMIEIVNDTITIPNWEKHQNLDKMEKLKAQNRERVARHREKQKLIASNDKCNVTVMDCNDTDIDKDKEIDIDIDLDIEEDKDKDKDKDKSVDIYTEEFENLWNLYPRKAGKTKALKTYQRARKHGTTYEEVEQGIKAYCKQIEANKTKTEYIKHGSTWFNNQCWLDEYEVKQETQSTDNSIIDNSKYTL